MTTITITRTTEFQRMVDESDPDFDLAAESDLTRLEANHHSTITHETITVAHPQIDLHLECSPLTTE